MTSTTEITAAAGPVQYAAIGWKALGSYVNLVVARGDHLLSAQAACGEILDRIDRTCSRFRDDSDLIRANRGAGTWVRVDPLLAQAVTVAIQVAESTGGLVDPTLGHQLVALGYDRDLAELDRIAEVWDYASNPSPSAITFGARPVTPDGWREIDVDPDGGVRLPRGVSLDLGATAKAFAADLIAAAVPRLTGTSLIISLGGDVAIGSAPDDDIRHHWRVSVAERPEDAAGREAEIVVLQEGGLATSSTLARRWSQTGTTRHHLLDPRTGQPADSRWRTASVCASTCVEANAASTASIVMGDGAAGWLSGHDLAARLVATDGSMLRLAGWPDPVQ